MKVLWACNVPIPCISNAINIPVSVYGGWIIGALNALVNIKTEYDLDLAVCCPIQSIGSVCSGETDGIRYYCFPAEHETSSSCGQQENYLQQILNDFKPDLLHIFGTEYAHSLLVAKLFRRPERTLVHIQGLCNECANYYMEGLPWYVRLIPTPRDIFLRDTIYMQKRRFEKRGQSEIELLKFTGHISGRTDWDRACISQVNSEAKYHYCNETLRNSFYSGKWELDGCERHSIFASSASYPIKGFHWLLEAMPAVLRQYPDAKLYVTGRSPLSIRNFKLSAYNKYLKELIISNHLQDCITFCGMLTEKQMKERYLKSNCFILPSVIENSPNSLGEAMMLGVPCIAADVGGVSSMMRHKIDGYIYQHNSPTMLASRVCELFSNERLCVSFSKSAAVYAHNIYDPNINAAALIGIYRCIY